MAINSSETCVVVASDLRQRLLTVSSVNTDQRVANGEWTQLGVLFTGLGFTRAIIRRVMLNGIVAATTFVNVTDQRNKAILRLIEAGAVLDKAFIDIKEASIDVNTGTNIFETAASYPFGMTEINTGAELNMEIPPADSGGTGAGFRLSVLLHIIKYR